MIQRKQTLFLFALIFLSIALLFIPVYKLTTSTGVVPMTLTPLTDENLSSTAGHQTAIVLNFLSLFFSSITIFLYRKLSLQLRICYALMIVWLVLTGMMAFCPFVAKTETLAGADNTYYGIVIGALGVIASYMSARHIKKDIELLKSADRIR
jgi:hypothetical protein